MRKRLGCLAPLGRVAGVLFLLLIVLPTLIPLARVTIECRMFSSTAPAPPEPSAEALAAREGLVNYTRDEERSYLTFPEWYIVYSADEYAAFIKERPPSQFPYFSAIGQYWQSYYEICAATRDRYPFNSGGHLALMVIGPSFTVENILKGLYENSIGRVTEWLSSDELTEEDAYARAVAEEYGTWLHTVPWYAFPFGEKLAGLWRETEAWGPNPIRKWERKLALSLEYGSKALYGWVIKQGTQSVYGVEDLETQLWAEGVTDRILRQEPDIRVVKQLPPRGTIVALPRYEPFTQMVPGLLRQGVRFIEIAGNDEILITVFAPEGWSYDLEEGRVLFALPVLPEPGLQRVAIDVPVRSLHTVLGELERQGIVLEHLYDY